jgi:hypothetical protein
MTDPSLPNAQPGTTSERAGEARAQRPPTSCGPLRQKQTMLRTAVHTSWTLSETAAAQAAKTLFRFGPDCVLLNLLNNLPRSVSRL